MIKLIVGNKGSGKTKTLIGMINEAAKNSPGNVVCIEKGTKLTYDIPHNIRLVDTEHYGISCYDAFYGFVAGLFAGNYDITDIYVDSILKVGGKDLEALADLIDRLSALCEETHAQMVFTVSADKEELPASLAALAL